MDEIQHFITHTTILSKEGIIFSGQLQDQIKYNNFIVEIHGQKRKILEDFLEKKTIILFCSDNKINIASINVEGSKLIDFYRDKIRSSWNKPQIKKSKEQVNVL